MAEGDPMSCLAWGGRTSDGPGAEVGVAQAAVVSERGAGIQIRDIVLPELDDDQVRVRVAAAGVCHSDLSMINGTLRPSFPLVLGHEASGVVTEVGGRVTRVSAGDRVVINW